jgi:hypothetical protein
MIVKVQIPLSDPNGPLYVYNESRDKSWMLDQKHLPPEALAMLRRDCARTGKAYYDATITGPLDALSLNTLRRVEDQPW